MPDRARVNDIHVSVRLPSDLAEAADEIGELYGVGRSTIVRIAVANLVHEVTSP